jgi:hypothetical protein
MLKLRSHLNISFTFAMHIPRSCALSIGNEAGAAHHTVHDEAEWCYYTCLKGTVARDRYLFFFLKLTCQALVHSLKSVEFNSNSPRYSNSNLTAVVNIVAGRHLPLYNMAASQNSPLTLWRLVKSRRDLVQRRVLTPPVKM